MSANCTVSEGYRHSMLCKTRGFNGLKQSVKDCSPPYQRRINKVSYTYQVRIKSDTSGIQLRGNSHTPSGILLDLSWLGSWLSWFRDGFLVCDGWGGVSPTLLVAGGEGGGGGGGGGGRAASGKD